MSNLVAYHYVPKYSDILYITIELKYPYIQVHSGSYVTNSNVKNKRCWGVPRF